MIKRFFEQLGLAVFFLAGTLRSILIGRIRWGEVFKEIHDQGVESVGIIAVTSFATGAVLALQGYAMLEHFGAKEVVADLVALSLVRELAPIFAAFIFSGKAGARMAAELSTMRVNDQITATRTLGVDPLEFLVAPRFLACMLVFPGLTVLSDIMGILGGYTIAVFDKGVPAATYIQQTLHAIRFEDFFCGFIKTIFFSGLISWICCFQGYYAKGGSLGVGQYTTRAVALSYILVVLSNTVLTKIILVFWP